LKIKSKGYWGNKAIWKLDFTTVHYTATRNLQIASFHVSPNVILDVVKEASGQEYK